MKKFTYFTTILTIFLQTPLAISENMQQELKVGALLCLSGGCAEWGSNALKGIELAAKEINSNGGVLGKKIKILAEDTKEATNGAQAVTAFKNLSRDNDIKYFLGPTWTAGGLTVAPLAKKRKDIIIISPSLGIKEFNETADNIFNLWPHDEYASRAIAAFAVKKWRKAAVFSSQSPWENKQGEVFIEEFKKLGGEITTVQTPLPTSTDLRTESTLIKQTNPDVVFLTFFDGSASFQLRQSGYKGPMLSILIDDTRLKAANGSLDGTIFTKYKPPSDDFERKFTAEYGIKPGVASDTGYDALNLLNKSISDSKTLDTDKVKVALQNSDYNGASGHITFDPLGGVNKKPLLYIVKGDKIEEFKE